MTVKGIVFDLDGVICFTDKYHFQAWIEQMEKINIKIPKETLTKLCGVSRQVGLDIILQDANVSLTQEQKDKICIEKNERYIKLLENMSEKDVDEDVLYTLKTLKNKNIKIAIGSGSRNAKTVLKKIGLYDMFDAIIDGSMINNSKPNPEVFLKASQAINVNPKECIVVEDATSGIDAANTGGFYSVGINSAYDYKKAKYKIKKLSELLEIISK